jgi:hypothetical protein
MLKSGDDKAGYEVRVEGQRVHLHAWGVWSADLADDYLRAMKYDVFPLVEATPDW